MVSRRRVAAMAWPPPPRRRREPPRHRRASRRVSQAKVPGTPHRAPKSNSSRNQSATPPKAANSTFGGSEKSSGSSKNRSIASPRPGPQPASRAAPGSSWRTSPELQAVTAVSSDDARFRKQVSGTSKASAPFMRKRILMGLLGGGCAAAAFTRGGCGASLGSAAACRLCRGAPAGRPAAISAPRLRIMRPSENCEARGFAAFRCAWGLGSVPGRRLGPGPYDSSEKLS